jgi:hypothetical protein
MSRIITSLSAPTWSRVNIMRQSGLLYKGFFITDRVIRHIREHAIYGPAELGNSHFFLDTEKLQAMKDLRTTHDNLFTYKDYEYRTANIAILGNIARMADIESGDATDGRVIQKFKQINGLWVQDTSLYFDAHIGSGPVKQKGKDITVHEHTSDLRVVTKPNFITDENFGLFPVVTAFPFVNNSTQNNKENE